MSLAPFYNPGIESGAYQLRYSWTGWPRQTEFDQQPLSLLNEIRPLWEGDGLRLLESLWTNKKVQLLFSCTPAVSPETVAARAKGRLDHALRTAGFDMPFSRKVSLRAIGENTRRAIEAYVAQQVSKSRFIDPRFAARMSELTIVDTSVDLSQPAESARGRYWSNLHLVLVLAEHAGAEGIEVLRQLRDSFQKIAGKKGHRVACLSIMPDHLHAALRMQPHESPLEVVFAYQNNLAYMLRRTRIFSAGFYVGTFGEYSMQAVRNQLAGGPG